MPPPPWSWPAPAPALSFSGRSEMRVSVVRTMAAIEAAFWSAERVTLAASTMPFLKHVAVLAGQGVVADAVP